MKIEIVGEPFSTEHNLLYFFAQDVQPCITDVISEVSAEIFHDVCPRIALLADPVAEPGYPLFLLECVFDPSLGFADLINDPEHPPQAGIFRRTKRPSTTASLSSFGESLPSQLHGTLPLPARNRGRHVWSQWAAASRKDKAVLAAHGRSGASRSSPSLMPGRDKSRLVTIPPEPVRLRHANRH
jgi:hypothetical protein